MKFAGRTPSRGAFALSRHGAFAGRRSAYTIAWAVAASCLLLCFLAASLRTHIGGVPPWPSEHALRPLMPGSGALPQTPRVQLAEVSPGWWQTFAAMGVFAGSLAQEAGPRGGIWLILLLLLLTGIWWGLAQVAAWRKPSVPLVLLVALQLFGAAFYLDSFRAPARRLQSNFPAFDFHVHTTRSNGLLSPQQQIDWHRARGFAGLAFTDSNRVMPEAELAALRAANPGMILLNGCEYHGKDAHLIVLGAREAVSAANLTVPAAIAAARKQKALVIAAHPWYPGRYTSAQWARLGVDGFEAWNGVIWDRDVAALAKRRRLITTTATDTLSKSGARCYTWTLTPRGLKDEDDVLRALRLRKTFAVFALSDAATPAAYEQRQAQQRRPGIVFSAASAAWNSLSRAQRLNTLLGFVAAGALLWLWGAGSTRQKPPVIGPNRALGFLRRRRLSSRLAGVLLMVLAFAASLGMALLTMGAAFKGGPGGQGAAWTPLHAIMAWILLDGLFLYGRSLWRRTQ